MHYDTMSHVEKAQTGRDRFLIKRMYIKNFRSLEDVDIQLEPITIFVGPNGAGKSNVLDALRFIRDIFTVGLDQAISSRGGIAAIRRWSESGRAFNVAFELEVSLGSDTVLYGFTIGGRRKTEYYIAKEYASLLGTNGKIIPLFRRHNTKWKIHPERGDLADVLDNTFKDEGLSFTEFSQSFLDNFPNNDLFLSKGAWLFFQKHFVELWQHLRQMGFYNLYPNAVREPQKPSNPKPLKEDGSNLASTLKHLSQIDGGNAKKRVVEYLKQSSSGVSDIEVQQVGQYLVTKVFRNLGGKHGARNSRRATFDLSQESDGTLRLLALLVALFQLPPLFIIGIEEPELNIHPGALEVLRDAVFAANKTTQILITTHSPVLLNEFPSEFFRVVENIQGSTRVGRMAKHQRKAIEDRLFSAGELLELEGFQRESD